MRIGGSLSRLLRYLRANWRRRWQIGLRRARGEVPLYAAVAAGSVLGSLARWLVSLAFAAWPGGAFPFATLTENILGSFAIGFIAAIAGPGGRLFLSARTRQFAMTGFCGGFTTFSAFSLETVRLAQDGRVSWAASYVGISIVAWLAAVWLGEALAARLNRLKGA